MAHPAGPVDASLLTDDELDVMMQAEVNEADQVRLDPNPPEEHE